jgi:hypothetical protein
MEIADRAVKGREGLEQVEVVRRGGGILPISFEFLGPFGEGGNVPLENRQPFIRGGRPPASIGIAPKWSARAGGDAGLGSFVEHQKQVPIRCHRPLPPGHIAEPGRKHRRDRPVRGKVESHEPSVMWERGLIYQAIRLKGRV